MQIAFNKEKLEMIERFITAWKGFSRKTTVIKTEEEYRDLSDGGYLFFQPSKGGSDVDLSMISPSKFYILNTEIFEEREFFCVDFKDLITLKFKNIVAGYLDLENGEVVFAEKKSKAIKTIKIPVKKSVEDERFVRNFTGAMKIYEGDREICQCEVEKVDLQTLGAFKDLTAYFLKNKKGELEIVQKEVWNFGNGAECRINTGISPKEGFLEFGFNTRDFLPLMSFFGEKVKFSVLGDEDKKEARWFNLNLDGIKVLGVSNDSPNNIPYLRRNRKTS